VTEVGLSARTRKRRGTARTLAGSVRANNLVLYSICGIIIHRILPRAVPPVGVTSLPDSLLLKFCLATRRNPPGVRLDDRDMALPIGDVDRR